MKNTEKLSKSILDYVFPPSLYCLCCGNIIDRTRTYSLCDHCIRHMRWDYEPVSGKWGMEVVRCAEYGLYERTLIFSLKYKNKKYIARTIAEIMADRLKLAKAEYDIIVPVPISAEKLKQRGFNQSALMGKYLSGLSGSEMLEHALERVGDTVPMRGLSPTEREMNIRGKIKLNKREAKLIKNKKVLLLDDISTTGSTARECAEILRSAEPGKIIFLAFAGRW